MEWFPELLNMQSIGITAFSSPFDLEAVKFLETLETPAYKIASNELIDWLLIEAVVKTKKPILLSTGINERRTPPNAKIYIWL